MFEAKHPVRMRLEGWAPATLCVAESTRRKPAKCGGGMGVGDGEAGGQRVGDYGHPDER